MEENKYLLQLKALVKDSGYYFVNFFMAVLVGLAITLVLDLPLKFIRVINVDLGHFAINLLGMCFALYTRSYRQGYHQNTRTYTFQYKRTLRCTGVIFAVQIALILIIGGHAVYISGPTYWLASFVQSVVAPDPAKAKIVLALYNWLFMLLADVLIYAPIMLAGEYLGARDNTNENLPTQHNEG